LSYTIEIIGLFVMQFILRYKYRVRWQKGAQVSYVYFNFDVKRSNPDETAKLSYIFQGDKRVHTPGTSRYHIGWLQHFNENPRKNPDIYFSDRTGSNSVWYETN
uniref:DUF4755 domain-containing protein n=1 Tax=Gongylonema pulchrum TaxID=637853 RepID=A0A183DIL5_9BILA